jgi:hypothetical protein
VLLAADAEAVVLHDPDPVVGGAHIKCLMPEFVDLWRYASPDVTGGVVIWIANRELRAPLDPPNSTAWHTAAINRLPVY